MDININDRLIVTFTEEEEYILNKASEILWKMSTTVHTHTVMHNEEAALFMDLGRGIENILDGNYWLH